MGRRDRQAETDRLSERANWNRVIKVTDRTNVSVLTKPVDKDKTGDFFFSFVLLLLLLGFA